MIRASRQPKETSMRTDVKIGIAVGLFLAIIVVVWVAFRGGKPETAPVGQGDQANVPVRPDHGDDYVIRPRGEEPTEPPPVVPRPEPVSVVPEPDRDSLPTFDPFAETGDPDRTETVRPEPEREPEPFTPGRTRPEPVAGEGVVPFIPSPDAPIIEDEQPAGEWPKKHTVEVGDGPWVLAKRYYGDGSLWSAIARANNIEDPRRIQVGTVLTIPAPPNDDSVGGPIDANRGDENPALASGEKVYTVKEGDMLWNIARSELGDGTLWPLIAQRNPGINANNLRVGAKIVIPVRPTTAPARRTATTRRSTQTQPAPQRQPAGGEPGGYQPPTMRLGG
jgi:nucleoid-associated protein YgaU